MKRIIFFALISFLFSTLAVGQNVNEVRKKLSDFYFGLSMKSDINAIKKQLGNNPEFKIHSDPNLDPKVSISGSVSTDPNLNVMATRNQLIIAEEPYRDNVVMMSYHWFIDYKLEDLAVAQDDFRKYKDFFKPYFEDVTLKQGIGNHQEEVESIYLKEGNLEVIIKMMKSNNFSHTISIECRTLGKKIKK